jgi:hypothetical protein
MNPVVRALGKVLRLVGISSPEDTEAKRNAPPPSWRTAGSSAKDKKPEKKPE